MPRLMFVQPVAQLCVKATCSLMTHKCRYSENIPLSSSFDENNARLRAKRGSFHACSMSLDIKKHNRSLETRSCFFLALAHECFATFYRQNE